METNARGVQEPIERGGSAKVIFYIKGPSENTRLPTFVLEDSFRRREIAQINESITEPCGNTSIIGILRGTNETRGECFPPIGHEALTLISRPLYRQFWREKVSRNYGVLILTIPFPSVRGSLECLSAVSAVVSSLFALHGIDSSSLEISFSVQHKKPIHSCARRLFPLTAAAKWSMEGLHFARKKKKKKKNLPRREFPWLISNNLFRRQMIPKLSLLTWQRYRERR